ncbi:hypothetical protein JCM9534A_69560 [Catenuloplanes indicus JCM 9534]
MPAAVNATAMAAFSPMKSSAYGLSLVIWPMTDNTAMTKVAAAMAPLGVPSQPRVLGNVTPMQMVWG